MYKIINFFDLLEDHVRGYMSRTPIIYSFLGGMGVILFWRGLWHTADYLQSETIIGSVLFSGPGSLLLGLCILLMSGLFVSIFIGESIVMSGMRQERKITKKTETELEEEKIDLRAIQKNINHIEEDLHLLYPHKNTKLKK